MRSSHAREAQEVRRGVPRGRGAARSRRPVGRSRRSLVILGSTRARSATGSPVTRPYGTGRDGLSRDDHAELQAVAG